MEEDNKFKKNPVVTGIGKIVVERQRQVIEKGYTPEHDAQHDVHDLLKAADAYMNFAVNADTNRGYPEVFSQLRDLAGTGWPWEKDSFKPVDVETALIKAGAMIAAALDHIENEKRELAEAERYRNGAAQKELMGEE